MDPNTPADVETSEEIQRNQAFIDHIRNDVADELREARIPRDINWGRHSFPIDE